MGKRVFGKNPFRTTSYRETYKNNFFCELKFPEIGLSEEYLEMMRLATKRNPSERCSAEKFLDLDVFNCNISDSENFEISYEPQKYLYILSESPFHRFILEGADNSQNSFNLWRKTTAL